MRRLLLIPALLLAFSLSAAAADSVGQDAVNFSKQVAQAVADGKKNGQYPTSVSVMVNGKAVEVRVTVTSMAEGFSVRAVPAAGATGCPVSSATIDVNGTSGSSLNLVSLVATGSDGSDIVAFNTTGTELAVNVTGTDNSSSSFNSSTAVADLDMQESSPNTNSESQETAKTETKESGDIALYTEGGGEENSDVSGIESGDEMLADLSQELVLVDNTETPTDTSPGQTNAVSTENP